MLWYFDVNFAPSRNSWNLLSPLASALEARLAKGSKLGWKKSKVKRRVSAGFIAYAIFFQLALIDSTQSVQQAYFGQSVEELLHYTANRQTTTRMPGKLSNTKQHEFVCHSVIASWLDIVILTSTWDQQKKRRYLRLSRRMSWMHCSACSFSFGSAVSSAVFCNSAMVLSIICFAMCWSGMRSWISIRSDPDGWGWEPWFATAGVDSLRLTFPISFTGTGGSNDASFFGLAE